ncbi:hypothetical protein CTAYLR_002368 [Chrysophaeum taylorii]|uniref:Uncharacterized protein n=1 Tax=Chrysophaeum taylorii TaxID=2483200 RepID=A0AAD7UH24_9STRA|nr:hypothetical protein CTAYLR_002368 [Chrysophaeum taylorii]
METTSSKTKSSDVFDLIARWVDEPRGRELVESKLKRRALLLSESRAPKKKTIPYAGGRRKERRSAQREERRKREAELGSWEETAWLREAWRRQAVGLRGDGAHRAALEMDAHGAVVAVVGSPVESYVGVCGVVIEETRQTFRVLEWPRPKVKFLPKRGLVFALLFEDPGPSLTRPCLLLDGDKFIDRL